ncbi:uncharacterized protein LOC125683541 isoform X2 [Ostrea edulis]|nr:uncharacterized protein LOC125683541 isoform X2 [Ostrea edulis]
MATVLQGPRSLLQKKISIPVDYSATFSFVSNEKGNKKYSLRRVLSKRKLPTEVVFNPDVTSDLTASVNLLHTDKLILQLNRSYQDVFLLGHNLTEDKVTSTIQKLPLYLTEVKIALVVGRTGYQKQEWDIFIQNLNEICDSQIQCNSYLGNPDIALYTNDSKDFDATVQVPNVYCTIYDCLNETDVYQSLHGLKPETHPAEEQCDTYEIIANCVRDKAIVQPTIATKPERKLSVTPQHPTADKLVADVAKGSDVTPKVPPRSRTVRVKDKRQISTSGFTMEECDAIASGVTEKAPKVPPRSEERRGRNVQSNNIPVDLVTGNVNEMNIEDVSNLLHKLGLEKYIPVFQKQWIDGAILNELNADILHSECGMNKIEAVRLMSYVKRGHIPR